MLTGLFCCYEKTVKNPENIKGIWVAITNDSIYEEIIVTDTSFYLWDEHAGDYYMTYKIENDSLKLYLNNRLFSARKFKRITDDEFIEEDQEFRVHFQRIKEYGDTAKILKIEEISSDGEYFFNYTQDLINRRYEWEELKKNVSR